MYSEVSICKEALALLGQTKAMISLDDNTKAARLCKQFYEVERNKLLRKHPWSFALKQAKFAKVVGTPLYDFTSIFRLPADCLKFVRPALLQVPFMKVGPMIYSNESEFYGLYIWAIANPIEFDALFVDALAIALAKKLCMPLISNRSRYEELHMEFKEAIATAKSNNAFETYAGALQQNVKATGFIDARRW
jgi:hypothetical protein